MVEVLQQLDALRGFMTTRVTCTNSAWQESVVESFHGIDSEAAVRRPGHARYAATQYDLIHI